MATEEKPIGVNGTEGESVASHTHNHESPAQTSGVTPSYNDEMTTETHGRGTKYNGGLDEKEVGIFQSTSSQEAVAVEERPSRIHTLWVRHKIWVYVAFELLMTGYVFTHKLSGVSLVVNQFLDGGSLVWCFTVTILAG